MLVEKSNLLQRVRVVMIALVAIIGFGTMAMKPVDPPHIYTYGVAETAAGLNWRIVKDVTSASSLDYDCNTITSPPACTVFSNSNVSPGGTIPKNLSMIKESGLFESFE